MIEHCPNSIQDVVTPDGHIRVIRPTPEPVNPVVWRQFHFCRQILFFRVLFSFDLDDESDIKGWYEHVCKNNEGNWKWIRKWPDLHPTNRFPQIVFSEFLGKIQQPICGDQTSRRKRPVVCKPSRAGPDHLENLREKKTLPDEWGPPTHIACLWEDQDLPNCSLRSAAKPSPYTTISKMYFGLVIPHKYFPVCFGFFSEFWWFEEIRLLWIRK